LRRFARLPSRILAVSAATFVGALGAVALTAAPASAHSTTLTSKTECVEGKPNVAKVTWTLTNNWSKRAELSEIGVYLGDNATAVATEVGRIKNGATVGKSGDTLVGAMEFSTTTKPPTLKGKATWTDLFPEEFKNEASWPEGRCAPTEVKKPTYSGVSTCDGMTVTIVNTSDAVRKFAVNGSGSWKEVNKELGIDEKWVVDVPRENARKVAVKYKLPDASDWENKDDDRLDWVQPDTCFEATSKSTCESLSITVANTGAKDIIAAVTVGDQSNETTIKPDTSQTIEIEGVDGLVAKLSVNGGTPQEFAWTKPTDCGGEGGGLPTTGVNAGLLAGGALVLVSGGGGLFYLARRRRIRFAA
jgi:hypothetical protein